MTTRNLINCAAKVVKGGAAGYIWFLLAAATIGGLKKNPGMTASILGQFFS